MAGAHERRTALSRSASSGAAPQRPLRSAAAATQRQPLVQRRPPWRRHLTKLSVPEKTAAATADEVAVHAIMNNPETAQHYTARLLQREDSQ